jgi:hypothetical protein
MATFPAEFDLRIDLGGPGTAAGIGSVGPSNVQADLNARPTAAALADVTPVDGGSALIGHRPLGNDGPGQTVQTKLDYLGAFGPEYLKPTDPAGSYYFSWARALNLLGQSTSLRTQPDGAASRGYGRITLPKGIMHAGYAAAPGAGFDYSSAFLGIDIVGHNMFGSALTTNSATGYGIKLGGYEGVHLADFYLRNLNQVQVAAVTSNGTTSVTGTFTGVTNGMRVTGPNVPANTTVVSGAGTGTLVLNNAVPAQTATLTFGGDPAPGDTSVGVKLVTGVSGDGGGLSLSRLWISGYHTAIKQDATNTGNGDKTLVVSCHLGGYTAYDQGANKQAIGWTFLNCWASCLGAHFKLGGAGETLIVNYTSNVYDALIQYPESSGNSGSGNYPGSRTTVMSTKLEYQGTGPWRIVDARESILGTNSGGSNADLVLREVAIAPGAVANEATNPIFEVGNGTSGSDAIRIKQEGGWLPGVARISAHVQSHVNRRWSFRDALKAPAPQTVQFLGAGNHYLLEWRHNENVPLDQYRGGRGFNGSIEKEKSYLIRPVSKYLANTSAGQGMETSLGGRIGANLTLTIPNTARDSSAMGGAAFARVGQTGLWVYVDEPVAHDTEVTQYTDNTFTTPIGSTLVVAAGTAGLFAVHSTIVNVTAGEIYVRITKPAVSQTTVGALVFNYFPYLGT